MSLNRALQAMLRHHGRPVRYLEDNETVMTAALLTPCGIDTAGAKADAAGIPEENRYVYIAGPAYKPPATGTSVYSGGAAYLVEESGAVSAGGAIDYVWALLQRCGVEEAEE